MQHSITRELCLKVQSHCAGQAYGSQSSKLNRPFHKISLLTDGSSAISDQTFCSFEFSLDQRIPLYGSSGCSTPLGLCHTGLEWFNQGTHLEFLKIVWRPIWDSTVGGNGPNFDCDLWSHETLRYSVAEAEEEIADVKNKYLQAIWEWSHQNSLLSMDVRTWDRPVVKMKSRMLSALVGNATSCVHHPVAHWKQTLKGNLGRGNKTNKSQARWSLPPPA